MLGRFYFRNFYNASTLSAKVLFVTCLTFASFAASSSFGQSCGCPTLCNDCKGGLVSLTLQYKGTGTHVVTIKDKNKIIKTFANVQPGDELAFTGQQKDNKFEEKEIEVLIDGVLNTAINVDCAKPTIDPNELIGDFYVIAAESKDNGAVCDKNNGSACAECKGGVVSLTIQYNGIGTHVVTIKDKNKIIKTFTNVQSGDDLTFTGQQKDNKFEEKEIEVFIDGVLNTAINVDCAKPTIDPEELNGDFYVIAADSKDNGAVCDINNGPACAECKGGVVSLTIQYNGTGTHVVTIKDKGKIIETFTNVQPGVVSTFTGKQKDNKFEENKIEVFVDGVLNATLDVDCKKLTFDPEELIGNFYVIAAESKDNGAVCCTNSAINLPPLITGCPADIYVEITTATTCDATVSWTEPVATDCDLISFGTATPPPYKFTVGTTSVKYTATDGKKTVYCTFNVVVVDKTPPTVTQCSADIVINTSSGCAAIATWTEPIFQDNCGIVSKAFTHNSGQSFDIGTTPVIYTATDAANNKTVCNFNVTVKDSEPPKLFKPVSNIVIGQMVNCKARVNWTPPEFNDNCTLQSTDSDRYPYDEFDVGSTPVTYTAYDKAGNKFLYAFDVVVKDVTAPKLSAAVANIVVGPLVNCKAKVTWTEPTFIDDCAVVSTDHVIKSGDDFSIGTTSVKYDVKDAAGNIFNYFFDVLVEDKQAPTLVSPRFNLLIGPLINCKATVTWTEPAFADNCAVTSIVKDVKSGDPFDVGTTTVHYFVKDNVGNLFDYTFDVTILDKLPPTVVSPHTNIVIQPVVNCKAKVTWTAPVFADNCAVTKITIKNGPNQDFVIGTTTVTYVAFDAAGNSVVHSFDITVNDIEPPKLIGSLPNINVNADMDCHAAVTWPQPNFMDCSSITVTATHPNTYFPIGKTTVTYTAKDAMDLTTTVSFDVFVKDVTPPKAIDIKDQLIRVDNQCVASSSWVRPTFSDCDGVSYTSVPIEGTLLAVGVTKVTYTVKDNSGNTASYSFNVTVKDDVPPIASNCPSDQTLSVTSNCEAKATWTPPVFSDNCTAVSVVSTHKPGDLFPVGKTTVKYTATDKNQNVGTCSFVIYVQDQAAPQLSACPETINLFTLDSSIPATWTPPIATDDCELESLVASHNPGDAFALGTTTEVTYTATDRSGHQTSCTFVVNVALEDISLQIGKLLTPGGSQPTDRWVIGNIDRYSESKVVIVDRWGSPVFEVNQYDNQNSVWMGQDLKGGPLPTGTYFYSISVLLGDSWQETKGFVELVR